MVKIMVPNPIKIDDLGGFPIFFGNTHSTSTDSTVVKGNGNLFFRSLSWVPEPGANDSSI